MRGRGAANGASVAQGLQHASRWFGHFRRALRVKIRLLSIPPTAERRSQRVKRRKLPPNARFPGVGRSALMVIWTSIIRGRPPWRGRIQAVESARLIKPSSPPSVLPFTERRCRGEEEEEEGRGDSGGLSIRWILCFDSARCVDRSGFQESVGKLGKILGHGLRPPASYS